MNQRYLTAVALSSSVFLSSAHAFSFEATSDYTESCNSGRDTSFCRTFNNQGKQGQLILKAGEYREPETYAMMTACVGLMGVITRRGKPGEKA